jgi:hypothetical protein
MFTKIEVAPDVDGADSLLLNAHISLWSMKMHIFIEKLCWKLLAVEMTTFLYMTIEHKPAAC